MESAVSLLKAEMGSEVCGTCAPHTFSRLVSTLCLSASVAALDAPPELSQLRRICPPVPIFSPVRGGKFVAVTPTPGFSI